MDTNRFTQKSMEALQSAQQLAQSYGNAQIEQIHLLSAMLNQEDGLIGQLMGKLGIRMPVKRRSPACPRSRAAISSPMYPMRLQRCSPMPRVK